MMNRRYRYRLGVLAAAVILAGTAALTWDRFFGQADSPTGNAAAFTGFANSSTHVKASLVMIGPDGVITLHIGRDWHVNANPASLDSLIASTVLIEHDGAQRKAQADYPAGKSSGIMIDGTDILVYEDGTRIPVHQLAVEKGDRIVMRVQACNNQGICLAPATIPVVARQA